MTDEPETARPVVAAPPPTMAVPPTPGDPEYDAFLREVQRLADERQAAQASGGGSPATRRAVDLVILFVLGAIGLALLISAWLGVFGQAAIATGAAVVGVGCFVVAAIWGVRVARSDRSAEG